MDDQGYEVLRGAVEAEAIEAYAREREAARDWLLARGRGGAHVELLTSAGEDAGAVDPYAIVQAARTVLLPEALTAGLSQRFGCEDDAPLLFDAAETAAAAFEDGPYRDASYVALASEPHTLITVVVALHDGASVDVHPGSQAIETTAFSGRYRHFNPERDGEDALARHREELAVGLGGAEPERIDLGAGDVLVLAADTVHHAPEGHALVAHFCPSRVRPGWFAYRPERAKHASFDDGRAWIATQHYDLVDALTPEPAREAQADEQELARVEEALRQHDAADETAAPAPATTPTPTTPTTPTTPPSAPRRSGGLVDSVRGILGRRNRD